MSSLAKRNEKGFTLLELSIALVVAGVLASMTVPLIVEDINARRAEITAQDTVLIMNAARSFRSANRTWPGYPGCATAVAILSAGASPYLPASISTNKFNNAVTTSCTDRTFSINQSVTSGWESNLSNAIPTTSSLGGGAIRSSITVPGSEGSLSGLISRVATGDVTDNTMSTDMLMGGNAISNAGAISAATTSTTGNITAGGNVTTSANATAASVTASQSLSAATITSTNNANAGSTLAITGDLATKTLSMSGESYTNGWYRSTGDGGWYNETHNGGWYMSDATWIRSAWDKNVLVNNTSVAGKIESVNRMTVGDIQLNAVVTEGSACAPSGLLGRQNDGELLNCSGGIWRQSGIVATYTYGNGSIFSDFYASTGEKAALVMATGGNCGGYNNLYIMADGAGIHKANNSSAGGGKINSISLAVPPFTAYHVFTRPFACSPGTFALMVSEF